MVSSTLCAPLADYMPGVRAAIIADIAARTPRPAPAARARRASCARGRYGQALVMSRKWKAALAPWLAGIPVRTGFVGEMRFGLLNDLRYGERKLPRMIDQMGALALPPGAIPPKEWPLPELNVPAQEVERWRAARRLDGGRAAHRHAVARRGRRRQGLAGRPLCRARGRARQGRRIGLGAGRAERDGDRQADRRGRRQPRARSHRQRPAQRHPGAGGRRRFRHQRFRPDACVGGDRHADRRHFRPDQPVALAAAQSRSPPSWSRPATEAPRKRARSEGNDAVRHRRTADVAVATVLASLRAVLEKRQIMTRRPATGSLPRPRRRHQCRRRLCRHARALPLDPRRGRRHPPAQRRPAICVFVASNQSGVARGLFTKRR